MSEQWRIPGSTKLSELFVEGEMDLILIFGEANVFYFTGYRGPGFLAYEPETETRRLYVPPLEYWRAENSAKRSGTEVVAYGKMLSAVKLRDLELFEPKDHRELISSLIEKRRRIGATLSHVSGELRELLGERAENIDHLVKRARAVKSREEIELIRISAEKTEKILAEVLSEIGSSTTIGELKGSILYKMWKDDLEGSAFDPIIAVEPVSAYPHAPTTSSERVMGHKILLIDLGGIYRGYCADITRTILLSRKPTEFRRMLEVLAQTVEEVVAEIRAGMPAREADILARRMLARFGMEELFVHGLGHGIGVEVHEHPSLSPVSEDVLEENMVITVEPGVYRRGEYGLRLENMVQIGQEGSRQLNRLELLLEL
ncbi:MAG: Xaa-Pro peptidase family protein [Fervidicoccaceae archaeon]